MVSSEDTELGVRLNIGLICTERAGLSMFDPTASWTQQHFGQNRLALFVQGFYSCVYACGEQLKHK